MSFLFGRAPVVWGKIGAQIKGRVRTFATDRTPAVDDSQNGPAVKGLESRREGPSPTPRASPGLPYVG